MNCERRKQEEVLGRFPLQPLPIQADFAIVLSQVCRSPLSAQDDYPRDDTETWRAEDWANRRVEPRTRKAQGYLRGRGAEYQNRMFPSLSREYSVSPSSEKANALTPDLETRKVINN